jgi:fluoride ion exporter CrcB/FEX
MSLISIACGVLLILIGVIGYGYGIMKGGASPTALIPAFIGLILAILGFVGKSKPDLRKHLMHGAVIIGLLGFLGTASSFIKIFSVFSGTAERPAAVIAQFLTAIVCLVFVILCVKSFIDARKARTELSQSI